MGTGDRSKERREALREAARRAVVAHGPDVRLVQVAQHAGITSGAVLYHYPDFETLLVEARSSGIERFYDARSAAVAGVSDPVRAVLTLVPLGLPADADDNDVRLLVELGSGSGRDPQIAEMLSDLFDREVDLYRSVLEAGAEAGVFDLQLPATTLARTIVALEDAYGQIIVARHPRLDREAAIGLILDVVRLGTGNPLVAAD
jgi:AcrR family transcriptional regulator